MKNKFYSPCDFCSEYFCLEFSPDETVSLTLMEIVNRRLQIYSFVDKPSSHRATRIKITTRTDYFGLKSQRDRITAIGQIGRGAFFTANVPPRGRVPAEKRRDAPRRAAEK